MPFAFVILFLLNILRASLQTELDNFFKVVLKLDIAIKFISKGAFTRARKKLKYQAFIELIDKSNEFYYNNYDTITWKGFFLKAVDGTTMIVPKNRETIEHFGEHKNKNGENIILVNVSQIFDSLNEITTSAILAPETIGERELLKMQINSLTIKDLLLLDRGYPAFWLYSLLVEKNINFCSRIEIGKWKIVDDFISSNKDDLIIELKPSNRSIAYCKRNNISLEPLKLRLLKIKLASGQIEILITTLIDNRKYEFGIFKELYHKRWPVEEDYKVMKHRLEIENFSGKSVESIYQDFHAKIFTKNLTAILKSTSQILVDEHCKVEQRKHQYKINYTNALSKMKNTIILLFTKRTSKRIINKLTILFTKEIEPMRGYRKYERCQKQRKKFHIQYKPIA